MIRARNAVIKGISLLLAALMVALLWPAAPILGNETAPVDAEEKTAEDEGQKPSEGEDGPEVANKKVIDDLTLGSLPFRADKDVQEAHAKAAVEEAIKGHPGFSQADSEDGNEDILGSFSLEDYPTSFAPVADTGFMVNVSFALSDALSEKYELVDPPSQIWVEPVASRQAPEGLLSSGAGKDVWTNAESIVASYPGWRLAKAVDGPYQDSVMMNSAEGAYCGVALFAMDDDSVITQITDISYNIDRTAPVITAFSVEGEHRADGLFWFFKTSARVIVTVMDAFTPNLTSEMSAETDQMPQPKVSGLSDWDARIEYRDSASGQTQTRSGITLSGEDDEQGIMQFILDGDQDTALDSYKAFVQDKAGNRADPDMAGVREVPPEVLALVTDASTPQLSVTFDGKDIPEGSFLSEGCTATFKITEPNFRFVKEYDPDQVIASIAEDDQIHVYKARDLQQGEEGCWYASYELFADAHYSIKACVTDLVGKSSGLFSTELTVDRTAPAVTVTFDNEEAQNGTYYQAPRTATVLVKERNFSEGLISILPVAQADNGAEAAPPQLSSWAGEGDDHSCTIFFPGPGAYSMTVEGMDLAHNPFPSVSIPGFIIDTEAPQITVEVGGDGDAARHAYRGQCALSVSIADAHVDPASTVDVQSMGMGASAYPYEMVPSVSATEMFLFGESPADLPENDGIYQLEVHARDMAGNTASKTVSWSVNRFGSTYALDSETRAMVDKGYLRSEAVQDVRITEVNPSGINEDDVMVSLASGPTNRTLVSGIDYSLTAENDNGWPACEYVIPKSAFAADGTYQITLHSTDAAGNASMNTLNGRTADRGKPLEVVFTVDDTAPVITFNGFSEPTRSGSFHEVGFTVEDNTKFHHAEVRVNGQEATTLNAEALADPDARKVVLYEAVADQAVTVEAYDQAGNRAVQDSPAIFVNSNPLVRWVQGALPIVCVIVGIIALGVAVFLLGRSRAQKKE